MGEKIRLADIPGLIEGAHEGAGLGDRFLGHVERCRVLLHLVDATEPEVAAAYKTIRDEMKAYGAGLGGKREIVALSKCDTVDAETLKSQMAKLQRAAKRKPIALSSATGQNVQEVLRALLKEIDVKRGEADIAAARSEEWRP